MRSISLTDLDLEENWQEREDARWRVSFPFTPAFPLATEVAATASTVVYFTLEPGEELGTHADSAEEVLFVVEGTVEASLDGETGELSAGDVTLVPAMAPHGVRNVGDGTARLLGVFPSPVVTSTFDEPVQPWGERVFGPLTPDAE